MIKISCFVVAIVFLFSCSEDEMSNTTTKEKSINTQDLKSVERTSDSYKQDSASYQKDSTSYVIGFKISQQFLRQSDFTSLNKAIICKGFMDEIGSYKKEECLSIIESYIASEDSRTNDDFSNQCARSMGRLTREEFVGKMNEIDAFYLIDEEMLNAGFKDGLNSKNIFEKNQKEVKNYFQN